MGPNPMAARREALVLRRGRMLMNIMRRYLNGFKKVNQSFKYPLHFKLTKSTYISQIVDKRCVTFRSPQSSRNGAGMEQRGISEERVARPSLEDGKRVVDLRSAD